MAKTSQAVIFFVLFLCAKLSLFAEIELGIDRLFQPPFVQTLQGKRVGLITNQTGVNSKLESTVDLLTKGQKAYGFELKALFGPEHGIYGDVYADKPVGAQKTKEGIPIYSLYGPTRRPTAEMLKEINLLIFDIQDLGSRSYTFATTLFYCMEEAAKLGIPLIVLDRPNPINGITVDGPMLEETYRTFVGYVNVPYCHGMTIAELAHLFNDAYDVRCKLQIVPMKGWKRWMSFSDTGLHWIPTSPFVPEATSPLYYPMTGLLGEMQLVSIGIGYSLPFKVVGAPWINAEKLVDTLNRYQLPGITFHPVRFRPATGRFAQKPCEGVLPVILDKQTFLPVTTQYLLISTLKELYPKEMREALLAVEKNPQSFFKCCGTKALYEATLKEEKPFQKLCTIHATEREKFLQLRKKHLYSGYE